MLESHCSDLAVAFCFWRCSPDLQKEVLGEKSIFSPIGARELLCGRRINIKKETSGFLFKEPLTKFRATNPDGDAMLSHDFGF